MDKSQVNLFESAVATNILAIRRKRKFSQEFLAFPMDISQNAFSKIELGYTQVTVAHLFMIAEALQCEVKDLLFGLPVSTAQH